jgi:hypothetical protein
VLPIKSWDFEGKPIIFMKAGPHSGNGLKTIIEMKLQEQKEIGKFFWGYSGSLCQPPRVQEFVRKTKAIDNNYCPVLLFAETDSPYRVEQIDEVRNYSTDGTVWRKLPKKIFLWNCKFAITACDLEKVNFTLNLNDYIVKTPNGPKVMGDYIRYRVSKACAFPSKAALEPKMVNISYACRVIPPYCIFVR